MKQVIQMMALPEWEIDGVKHQANEPRPMFSPTGFDAHVTLPVGKWVSIPSNESGFRFVTQMRERSEGKAKAEHPELQRFAFQVVEELDDDDKLADILASVPIKKLEPDERAKVLKDVADRDDTIAKLHDAVAEMRAKSEALEKENADLRALVEKETAPAKAA